MKITSSIIVFKNPVLFIDSFLLFVNNLLLFQREKLFCFSILDIIVYSIIKNF